MASAGPRGADSGPVSGCDHRPAARSTKRPPGRREGWACSGLGAEGRRSSRQACGRRYSPLKSKPEKHPHGDQRDPVLQEEVTQKNTGQRVPCVPLPSLISRGTVQSRCSCRPLAISPAQLPVPAGSPVERQFLTGRG